MQNSSFGTNLSKGIKARINGLLANRYKTVNLNWFKLKYYKHLPVGKEYVHVLFNKKVYFHHPPDLIHGLTEIFLEKVYLQELQDKPFVIDCGAHIGLSIIYIKGLYPEAEIIAFEPDETNFNLLTRNIMSFGYTKVSLFKQAVWTENTILHFSNTGSMGSKIENHQNNSSAEVSAIRLRDIINKDIDFLKIDIEGAEFSVLKDIRDKLFFVKNMFVEYHGTFQQNNELTELISLVTESGFKYYIKEATSIYTTPFSRTRNPSIPYDVQLNLFCFRD